MQRMVFAALVGLSVAIGLTVGSVAWRTASFDRTMPDQGVAEAAIGYAFYAGIDSVLAGGDAAALKQAVSGDFVDHVGDGASSHSTKELIEQLTAFRASFPGTKIQVTDIQVSASNLVAMIAPIAPQPVAVTGAILTAQPSHGGHEVLRIRNGKVSERWTAGLPELSVANLDAAMITSATANITTRLDRITLPRGSSLVMRTRGATLFLVERGTVRFGTDFIGYANQVTRTLRTLEIGSATGIKDGSRIQLESDGDDPAQLLIYSTWRITPVDPPPPTLTGGASNSLLWAANLPFAGHNSWRITSVSLNLPPGERIGLTVSDGTTLLLCSEEGSMQVVAPGSTVETLNDQFVASGRGNASTIEAGVAANIADATEVTLRPIPEATAAAKIWLIAIAPEGTSEGVLGTPER
jgi:hypothetical protein